MSDEFMTPAMVHEFTGIPIASLSQMRYERGGPRFFKPTYRTVLYRRSNVIAWVEKSVQKTREFA